VTRGNAQEKARPARFDAQALETGRKVFEA
jgi:hypothetical protein